MSRDFEVDSK